jgi:ribosomal protein L11 methyltransferase
MSTTPANPDLPPADLSPAPAPRWREVSFVLAHEEVERWSDALLEAGALSVQAEDADADTTDEQAIFGEPDMPQTQPQGWHRTRLSVLLAADVKEASVFAAAAASLDAPEPRDRASRLFADEDWVRQSQAQFEPIPIGERLLITPSWHRAGTARLAHRDAFSRDASRLQIVLDPGLAFGTGSHPTTRLCLQWLERHLHAGESVIDYGCGSGILAIAAARLGAGWVPAVDIDEQALASTRHNAAVNDVSLQVQSCEEPLSTAADVVVANILATPLKLLAPLLQDLVKPGGALILAGLLERQVDEVASHYPRMALSVFSVEDGWACLAGRKSG